MKNIFLVLLAVGVSCAAPAQEKQNQDSIAKQTEVKQDTASEQVRVPIDTLPESALYYRINRRYFKSYWDDFKHVAVSPFHWKGRDWRNFAIVSGASVLMYAVGDKELRGVFRRNVNPGFTTVSEIAYPIGNRFPPLMLTGMYLTSVIFKERRMEHATLNVVRSLVISTVFYTASKTVIRRQRPVRSDDPHDFIAPFSKNDYTSFPSGHSNTAFSVATAFALEYPEKKWIPWVGYSLATLTALSRMYDDRHWASDIIIGASIGHFITRAVYQYERKKMEEARLVY